ncbi:MAG: DNA topoisomerase 1 [Chlamydiae bacterium]|nr:DNA topoisomerase 1 [Chlamydiota bacterium]
MKSLIIVESPAKIKTLKKFLGKDFIFASSVGHIRDLPEKGFGIDIENDFEPEYQVLADKKKVVADLKKAAKECDIVYLSPDPDREGEAIAWHIASILPAKTKIKRAAFYAITKEAVQEAIANPKDINIALVNAQQARRLLDRIVGYKISPILARKLQRRSGVSAGRVQSVALKLVVDREKEIEAFKPVEYWNIGALLRNGTPTKQFSARLYSVDGKRWDKEAATNSKKLMTVGSKADADKVVERLNKAKYHVENIEKKEKKRHPEPPFITSTLQQEASRHFRFSSSKTMSVAQTLYEGIDLDSEGAEGLITYMRTDSFRVEAGAINDARQFVSQNYGDKFLPESPCYYKSKKSAQDAHEAIHPTKISHPPEQVKGYLTHDQFLLYTLIWERFIASQMNPAIYDTVSCDVETNQDIALRATGSTIKFRGFLSVYEEKKDEEEEKAVPLLPPLKKGQSLNLIEVTSEQAFTKPPPRFSEALLVKELEKSGIGRPSTYASIMNKIQRREYTIKENRRLKPTELGTVIAQFLEDNFKQIMNISFTASMEDALELVAADKKEWKAVIREFWKDFIPTVEIAAKEAFIPKILTDIDCPKCGAKLHKVWSKSQYFFGCSAYPECDYTASIEEFTFKKEDYSSKFNWEQACPQCGNPMKVKHGRFGPFLGCTTYPKCKGIVNIPKEGEAIIDPTTLPHCPAIGCDGRLAARKSRYGKTFFSCTTFPDCDVIVNDLAQIEKKYPDHPKTAYVKKKKTGGGRGARGKFPLSPELQAIVDAKEMSRGDVMKKVWEYIKAHDLQDPNDKRQIVPDEKMAALFGNKESLNMFKLSGIIGKHLKR